MQSDNSVYYVSSSTTSGFSRTLDYYGQFTESLSAGKTALGITMTLNSRYSTTRTQVIYLYNFATSQWVQMASNSIGTSDQTVTFTVSSGVSNYINASGNIRVRIYATGGFSTWSFSNDYFRVDVTYTP